MVERRSLRALSYMVAILISLAIVAFVGIVLFGITSGFFGGGGAASLTVSGTGSGSNNGAYATLYLTLQNSGGAVARVSQIVVAPTTGGATITGIAPAMWSNAPISYAASPSPPSPPAATPTTQYDVPPKASSSLTIQLNGAGLYPGARVIVYIAYYDLGSAKGSITSVEIQLR